MASTKTSGITTDAEGNKTVDKCHDGVRIFRRLGAVAHQAAETWLAGKVEQIRLGKQRGARPRCTFADAATRFLREAEGKLRSHEIAAWHVTLLAPFIGARSLDEIHDGTLEGFVKHRLDVDKVSLTTVNRSLEVVRRVLNLAARKYRHENGVTWLESAPLISIDTKQARLKARRPYPLSWEEQDLLFAELPDDPNRQMALFKVNTGTREQEVCKLRWAWEVKVPELNTSVFIVPGQFVKNAEDRLIVLNNVAKSVIEARRGMHAEFVFSYRWPVKRDSTEPERSTGLECMNNTAWQNARERAAQCYAEKFGKPAAEGFRRIRVHDLKHTFGRRLRAAGVGAETRKALLGHTNGDITTHYSGAEVAELINAVNKIDRSLATPAITLLRTAA